jgi:Flp pilus assembly protein TadB
MRSKRRVEALRSRALVDALTDVADALRSGASLRQALVRSAHADGSPFRPVAAALQAGRPLSDVLHVAAVSTEADPELASACCVLAVHAGAGGDPLPATRALAERAIRRATARDHARSMSTQARLGARAILMLTPAFLLLVGLSDPKGATAWVVDPSTRVVVLVGIALQGLGAFWVAAIVGSVGTDASRWADVPAFRVFRAIALGRARPTTDRDVADVAETAALAADAGLSATAVLAAIGPYAPGPFGERLREAIADVRVPIVEALSSRMRHASEVRFARAILASVELGAPLAAAMRSLSVELRERIATRDEEDARRASMRVLAPLALLILPAFVLSCLVPLFLGGLQGIAG